MSLACHCTLGNSAKETSCVLFSLPTLSGKRPALCTTVIPQTERQWCSCGGHLQQMHELDRVAQAKRRNQHCRPRAIFQGQWRTGSAEGQGSKGACARRRSRDQAFCKIDLPQRSSDCPFRAALEATLSHIYIYSKAY